MTNVPHVNPATRKAARPLHAGVFFVAAAGVLLCALAFALVVTSDQEGDRPLVAFVRVLVFAVPIAVGLWAWGRPEHARFGRLLVGGGCLWALTTLAESNDEVLYSIGRVAAWVTEPVLIVLMLAFPSGFLVRRRERLIAWSALALAALLYLPSALLAERFAEPTPWGSCGESCPDNAFMLLATEPAFVDALLRPVRETATVVVFLAVALTVGQRVYRATPPTRSILAPVLAVAVVRCVALSAYVVLRVTVPDAVALDVVGWVFVLCLPAMAVAFLGGILQRRLHAADALRNLAFRLRDQPDPTALDSVLRETLGDPSLRVCYWLPGPRARWVDSAGHSVDLRELEPWQTATEVRSSGGRVAALVHDRALMEQSDVVEAAGSLAVVGLENQRLTAQVDASLEGLRESRARIQAAADSERQRIERDLHDGAQQRLVALRVRLELAGELMRDDPARGVGLVRELGAEAEEALEEVRALAGGIYPPLLADRGLRDALRGAALRASIPTRFEGDGIGRYPEEIESAVYFCCLEALQNAAKHAAGATAVVITVADGDALRFSVRDDGAGFVAREATSGRGLTNMRDRLAAVGGALTIDSSPGLGTAVVGVVPVIRAARSPG